MIEFISMVIISIILWLFIVCPAMLGMMFDYAPSKYLDAVKGSLCFTLFIVALCFVVLCFGLVISFMSGDHQPITTLIERITST